MKYDLIVEKIADQSLTLEEFNSFIAESMGGSVVERVRRRSRVGIGIGIDNPTGHSRIKPFKLAGRVHPKKKPIDPMNHGATKPAHDQSTRTQQRKAKAAATTEGKLDTLLKLLDDQKITVTELHDKLASSQLSVSLIDGNAEDKSDDRAK
jgi:uncharacterized coiled-coil protein SlyX